MGKSWSRSTVGCILPVVAARDGAYDEDKHSKMNGEQMRDRSTGRLSEDTLAEAICELPGCMQLLIRLRIMGLPVSCKHTQLAETVQAIVDEVGR